MERRKEEERKKEEPNRKRREEKRKEIQFFKTNKLDYFSLCKQSISLNLERLTNADEEKYPPRGKSPLILLKMCTINPSLRSGS